MVPTLPDLANLAQGHGRADEMFTTADTAARLAVERLSNAELCQRVDRFTGNVLPVRGPEPVFLLIRAIPSWDHEMVRFIDLCHTVGARPLVVSMLGDRFTSLNPDKYRRARMTFWFGDRTRVLRAADMRAVDGRAMTDLVTRRGTPLAAFHADFLGAHHSVPTVDLTSWLRPQGKSDYLHFFALCMVGAVLVEAVDVHPLEQEFMHERMLPGWERARTEFGHTPLMTSHFSPAEITDDFWWGYPGTAFLQAAHLLYGAA
jgi:hypothetical protein